jgi:hypothetical protein
MKGIIQRGMRKEKKQERMEKRHERITDAKEKKGMKD